MNIAHLSDKYAVIPLPTLHEAVSSILMRSQTSDVSK